MAWREGRDLNSGGVAAHHVSSVAPFNRSGTFPLIFWPARGRCRSPGSQPGTDSAFCSPAQWGRPGWAVFRCRQTGGGRLESNRCRFPGPSAFKAASGPRRNHPPMNLALRRTVPARPGLYPLRHGHRTAIQSTGPMASQARMDRLDGRSGKIRTCGVLLPKQTA